MFDRLRNFIFGERKDNPTFAASSQYANGGAGLPVMMPRNMAGYIQEGYRGNKTVFRVVGQIARSGAGIKWKHYYDKTKQREYTSSPLLDLWEQPNKEEGGAFFREKMLAYYCMTGNNYLVGLNASGNPGSKFDELWTLRPDLTKVHATNTGVDFYEYGNVSPPKQYAKPFVMHNKLFAGNDDVYGLSPIEVAAILVDIQKAGQKWNLGLMGNMAKPGGAWITDQVLNDTDYRGLKKEIREKFAGPRNAGETVILHGGVKWQPLIGMSPMELDWLETDTKGDRDIAGIFFNFPVFLLGLADTTFNNQNEAKYFLYTDIIFPIWDLFVSDLNRWLVPRYGGYLDYDREDVETIQERIQAAKAAASDRAQAEFTGGTATFLEAREIQGKQPLKIKDFVLLNNIPVHVDQLDAYIEAQSDKVINPPPPPPALLPPGKTTVTELPNGDNPDDPTNDDSNAGKSRRKSHSISAYRRHLASKALDLETAESKSAYFASMEDAREQWTSTIQERFADYFKDERKTIYAAVSQAKDVDDAEARIAHALSNLKSTFQQVIVSLYQDVGGDIGSQVAESFENVSKNIRKPFRSERKDAPNMSDNQIIQYLLEMAGEQVSDIDETTLEMLQQELADGVAEGESIPELADRIDSLYLDEIIPNRSTTIARTEVLSASNWGAMQAASQSGLTLNKVWLATSDSRTRPDHRDADGQEVGMDEPFLVGGAEMMQPGDPAGPADEVINCRCTVYFKRTADIKQRHFKFNPNHDSHGEFASGGGGSGSDGEDEQGFTSADKEHISGSGPIDGETEHTVTVHAGGEDHQLTDKWTAGDVHTMLHSDYATVLSGTEDNLQSAQDAFSTRQDTSFYNTDAGETVMFHNDPLSADEENDLENLHDVSYDESERPSGGTGTYHNFEESQNNTSKSLILFRPDRETYRSFLRKQA